MDKDGYDCESVKKDGLCGDSYHANNCMKTCGWCCYDLFTEEVCQIVKMNGKCGDPDYEGKCMKTCGQCCWDQYDLFNDGHNLER